MPSQGTRVREILSELRAIWAQKHDLEQREAALEAELVGQADAPTIIARAPRVMSEALPAPRAIKPPPPPSTAEKAERRRLIEESSKRMQVRISGSGRSVEVPRWVRTKVLDKINEFPGRRFKPKEMVEELESVTHLSVVIAAMGQLAAEGFIRRLGRYVFVAQNDPEPQMGEPGEDALDHAGPLTDDLVSPSSADVDDLPDDEGAAA